MGRADRLREEGKTDEEIADIMSDGAAPERPQNPETARRSGPAETETELKPAAAKKSRAKKK